MFIIAYYAYSINTLYIETLYIEKLYIFWLQ